MLLRFPSHGYRGKLRWMKVREILKRLKADGRYRIKASGGHRQFKNPTKAGLELRGRE